MSRADPAPDSRRGRVAGKMDSSKNNNAVIVLVGVVREQQRQRASEGKAFPAGETA